ncbi:SixA phosphatase family protein [Bifidobacterium thermophilum]|uniref:SixA phosphatase family protein n=1 Tax=Bifidobacterium thermophilum TaxID=33905 RepID=UPI0030A16628
MGQSLKKIAKTADQYGYVLLVMRHAKTEPANLAGDRARELTDKGRRQAKNVARGIESLGMVPDRIACSGAVRAEQTLERMLKVFGDGPKVDYRQSLYEGGVQAVFDEIARTADKYHTLMVVGHEPTVSIASEWIASERSEQSLLNLLQLGLSPASVVMFGSDKPFSSWQVHAADLFAVLSPKDFGD